MTLGDHILETIISGSLCTGFCPHHDEDKGIIIVWSSGAAEQIEAAVEQWMREQNEKMK